MAAETTDETKDETAPEETAPPESGNVATPDEAELGDKGKAALAREREARKQAEKEAREMKTRLDALERDKLSDEEKLRRDAEDGKAKEEAGTDKLRKANLLVALAEKGLTGQTAKAAIRLLDDVEYDADDEPKNLDEALTSAKESYGEAMFAAGAKPATDTHQGKRRDADPDEDEQFAAYMRQNFPETQPSS